MIARNYVILSQVCIKIVLVDICYILVIDFIYATFHIAELGVDLFLPQKYIAAKVINFLQRIASKYLRDYLFPNLANIALDCRCRVLFERLMQHVV